MMITVVGTETLPPVTKPVVAPTEAIVALLLPHVPPVVASLSNVVNPAQTCSVPVTGDGAVFTVTIAVALQPVPIE